MSLTRLYVPHIPNPIPQRVPYNSGIGTRSTDMGDLSSIMPVIHPYAGGVRGKVHGNDYEIYDPEAACVTNAKWQIAMMKLLLENGTERAKKDSCRI